MPTRCHMLNSTLTGSARVWFDDLPLESIDSYDDLKKAFLANFLQQKNCIKDLVEIHHMKQRERESKEDFMQRFKAENRNVKGASECTRIFGFMHGITNLELIKRLYDNIPMSVDEMMRKTNQRIDQSWKAITLNQGDKARRRNGSTKSDKKGEISRKDKAMEILMVRPWQKVERQRITQSFSPDLEVSVPPLGDEDGTEGPMIIEKKIGGHFIHRIYVDRG
ncbi:reverse transcriptase domain-containing protein [Tanacetum coccineum]